MWFDVYCSGLRVFLSIHPFGTVKTAEIGSEYDSGPSELKSTSNSIQGSICCSSLFYCLTTALTGVVLQIKLLSTRGQHQPTQKPHSSGHSSIGHHPHHSSSSSSNGRSSAGECWAPSCHCPELRCPLASACSLASLAWVQQPLHFLATGYCQPLSCPASEVLNCVQNPCNPQHSIKMSIYPSP